MNKYFRVAAVIIFMVSMLGVFLGYHHQGAVALISIIIYVISKDDKKAPGEVKSRRVFEVND